MNITIVKGGKSLIASGTVILDKGENEFLLKVEDLEFLFVFKSARGSDPQISTELTGGKRATLTLTDWSNPLGTSYVQKDIATIGSSSVDLGFFLYSIGDESAGYARMFSYSIYHG